VTADETGGAGDEIAHLHPFSIRTAELTPTADWPDPLLTDEFSGFRANALRTLARGAIIKEWR
jgi:hypothetical protein